MPMEYPKIRSRLDLCRMTKDHEDIIKSRFREILSEYPNYLQLYTDGSKTNSGVGSALVVLNNSYSWTLPVTSSVYTAELYALWHALLYCEHSNYQQFIICTDSLSAILSISKIPSNDPLSNLISALRHMIHTSRKDLIFVYTPSHVGIRGNELADQAARAAANDGNIEDIPINPADNTALVKTIMHEKWQRQWDNTTTKLKAIKPEVTSWTTPKYLSRREQVVLTRLRIGHTNITSNYLLLGEERPECTVCNTTLTVKHIIEECEAYRQIRAQLNMPNDIAAILCNSKSSVMKAISFCKITGLFKKL